MVSNMEDHLRNFGYTLYIAASVRSYMKKARFILLTVIIKPYVLSMITCTHSVVQYGSIFNISGKQTGRSSFVTV